MTTKPWHASVVVAVALAACGGNRVLVGQGPDGAAGAGSSAAGAAGSAGPATGQAAAEGAAGSSGAAFTGAAGVMGTPPIGHAPPLPISGTEALTRAARVLWNDVPDPDMLENAADPVFTQDTTYLAAAIGRMLADPRAAKGVGAFYRWWLSLDTVANVTKDPTLFPTYTRALQADMANETETFGVKVTLDMNGSYGDLLTDSSSYINARLADVYGVAGVTGDDLQRVTLPANQRAGLLTQPAILVQGTNVAANDPSMRGAFIASKFFCKTLPEVPTGENSFPTPPAGTTVRAALMRAVGGPACTACHDVLDPPGYALENFDAIGRWRTTDNGGVVEASNLQIVGLFADVEIVNGFSDLAKAIAGAPEAQRCMARQWEAFALGRAPSELKDQDFGDAYVSFVAARLDLKTLITAVLTSDAFLAPHLGLE